MDPEVDAERRIAELQRQLDQERRINDLQRQLAQERSTWTKAFDGFKGRAPVDTRLSAPPRRIPMRFVLAELLPFRWWYLTAMFVVAVPAIIVWVTVPTAALPAAVLTLVAIYAWQLVGTRTRLRLLKWGRVATVVDSETVSRASYYGGTTWYNAPLPVADGWRVTRPLWSGPSTTTRIRYVLDEHQGEMTVRGREYVDGIVLADQRHPDRARCVTYFPYDLDRDEAGDWVGRLRPRLVLGMVVWLLIVCVWLCAATAITTGYATKVSRNSQVISVGPGGSVRVSGSSLTREVACNDGGDLRVDGTENVVTVTGRCTNLTVSGIKNTVTVGAAWTITLSGIDCHVTYRVGDPKIVDTGIRNTATLG